MRTIKDIEKLVAEQAKSGASVPVFCAERGLKVKSFGASDFLVDKKREFLGHALKHPRSSTLPAPS
jgi:hypothetical protein